METVIRLTSPPEEKGFRLVFGNPSELRALKDESYGSCETEAVFPARKIFCLEVYHRFLFGKTKWALYVAKSVDLPEEATFIPNVYPGARVLLEVRGKAKVIEATDWISEIQLERDPAELHEAFFCKQHAMLNTSFAPRAPRKPFFTK